MKISDVARIVGVSTRTIRHYHHVGVLPEPPRAANGYRTYTVRDVALLAKIRKLIALGLTLEEVADALADKTGTELEHILAELDTHLAEQQAHLQEMRDQIKAHLAAPDTQASATTTATASALLTAADAAGATGDVFALDQELFHMIPDAELARFLDTMECDPTDPATAAILAETYQLFEWLKDADPSDADVVTCADNILKLFPPHVLAGVVPSGDQPDGAALLSALQAELRPAQWAAVQRVIQHLPATDTK